MRNSNHGDQILAGNNLSGLGVNTDRDSGYAYRNVLFIPLTCEEIANRHGAARERIARHISALKHPRLIAVMPYQIIRLDKEAFEELLQ